MRREELKDCMASTAHVCEALSQGWWSMEQIILLGVQLDSDDGIVGMCNEVNAAMRIAVTSEDSAPPTISLLMGELKPTGRASVGNPQKQQILTFWVSIWTLERSSCDL